MSRLTTFQLVAASVHFVPALVWAIVAQNSWRFARTRHPRGRFFRMLPVVAATVALAYSFFTLLCLTPRELRQQVPPSMLVVVLYVVNDLFNFTVVALAHHLSLFFATPEPPAPGRRWLAVNYGSSLAMDALAVLCIGERLPAPYTAPALGAYNVLRWLYQLIMLGSVLWHISRVTRPGAWKAGGAAWVPRRADLVFLGAGLLGLTSWIFVLLATSWRRQAHVWPLSPWGVVLDAVAGIGFATPLAMRILGEVVRGCLVFGVTFAAAVVVYFGSHPTGAALASAGWRPLLDIGTVFLLALLFVPGQGWVRRLIDSVVFRRNRRRQERLQAFLQMLPPDVGRLECCRRALAEITDVMRLRGAAMFLDDGAVATHGAIDLEPFRQLWTNASAGALPGHALVGYELRELPADVVGALTETDVAGVVPLRSPRRAWGVLLISTGLLAAAFRDEDERLLELFASQMALVLDATELLARTVAVERSLAHSEKLAAIGELAARVAHEIRNPLTAARSLAQLLAREPTSPLNAEHAGLILAEIERVERQVAALLRFARREEYVFAPTDLGDLTRAAAAACRPRLEAAGIELELTVSPQIIVRADAEKLRQVLINLIENAADALTAAATRRLTLSVADANGGAAICVSDSGPGVPPAALPRLFEPFFSLKPHGTGLGLAIAKRTVDAHGGTIEAVSAPGAGATFRITVPLADRPPPAADRMAS